MTAKFWMVIDISEIEQNPNGEAVPRRRAPTFIHETKDSAVKEMFRLQTKYTDGEFVVLEAVSGTRNVCVASVLIEEPITNNQ